jgi:hypothetical protein
MPQHSPLLGRGSQRLCQHLRIPQRANKMGVCQELDGMKKKKGSWAMLGLLCVFFSVIAGLCVGLMKGAPGSTDTPDFQEKWRAYQDVHIRQGIQSADTPYAHAQNIHFGSDCRLYRLEFRNAYTKLLCKFRAPTTVSVPGRRTEGMGWCCVTSQLARESAYCPAVDTNWCQRQRSSCFDGDKLYSRAQFFEPEDLKPGSR